MDSSAIYVDASSNLVDDSSVHRWELAEREKHAYETDLVPHLMKWEWHDFRTGKTLGPAFDEPPTLPELSRWMPTDPDITWDDIVIPSKVHVDSEPEEDLDGWNVMNVTNDSVLVYQYA
jgi:hypothetical protein